MERAAPVALANRSSGAEDLGPIVPSWADAEIPYRQGENIFESNEARRQVGLPQFVAFDPRGGPEVQVWERHGGPLGGMPLVGDNLPALPCLQQRVEVPDRAYPPGGLGDLVLHHACEVPDPQGDVGAGQLYRLALPER